MLSSRFDATELRARVKELTRWPDMPQLDEPFIRKNVEHLRALGAIPASATAASISEEQGL